jgi:hypothetical protein
MPIQAALHRTALLPALAVLAACQEEAPEGAIAVPSGREVRLIDVVTNAPGNEGAAARFRFLAPGLEEADLAASADDMQALCDTYALPRIDGMVPEPQQIIISLAAEAVPFGQAAPDVVQFFEIYRVEGDACQWEPF